MGNGTRLVGKRLPKCMENAVTFDNAPRAGAESYITRSRTHLAQTCLLKLVPDYEISIRHVSNRWGSSVLLCEQVLDVVVDMRFLPVKLPV